VARLALCAGLVTFASVAAAQEMEVPVAIQIPLFLKVLAFDRQLHARAGAEVVLGVVFQSGNRASVNARDEVMRAISSVRDSVDGLPVRAVAIDLDKEPLAGALTRNRVTVMYVAPLRAIDIAAVAAEARTAHVTTMTGVPDYVGRGLAVSVRLQGDRPKLLVNLNASRLEGADLSAELLKLAVVIQ
jgi:hypothetical protein